MADLTGEEAVQRWRDNEDRVNIFTNGDENAFYTTTVETGEVEVPSVQKFLKTKDDEINVEAGNILSQCQTSEANALVSETNAANSAADAANSAALTELPDPAVADTYLKRNAGNTLYEAKSEADVAADAAANFVDGAIGYEKINKGAMPLFKATLSTLQPDVTGDGTTYKIIFDNEIKDKSGDYDHTTGLFTASEPGEYMMITSVTLRDLDADTFEDVRVEILTTDSEVLPRNQQGGGNYETASGNGSQQILVSGLVYLDAGDTAQVNVFVRTGTKTVDIGQGSATHFAGYLVARD